MASSAYHHSQRTRFTAAEAERTIGKRASLTLEGEIVEVRDTPVGACVIFEIDERFGFGPIKMGGDLELFDVRET
jgi:hypothetical protein